MRTSNSWIDILPFTFLNSICKKKNIFVYIYSYFTFLLFSINFLFFTIYFFYQFTFLHYYFTLLSLQFSFTHQFNFLFFLFHAFCSIPETKYFSNQFICYYHFEWNECFSKIVPKLKKKPSNYAQIFFLILRGYFQSNRSRNCRMVMELVHKEVDV